MSQHGSFGSTDVSRTETKVRQISVTMKANSDEHKGFSSSFLNSYYFDATLVWHLIYYRPRGYLCILYPFLCLAFFIGFGIYFVHYQTDDDYQSKYDIAVSQCKVTASFFELTVNQAFIPLYALRSVVQSNPFATQLLPTFNSIAKTLIDASSATVSNLGMAPNGINIVKYPLEGNEKAIGHDLFAYSQPQGYFNGSYFSYPSRRRDSLNAVAYRDVYFTGPKYY